MRDLVTVIGNLVDNALDSVTGSPGAGWIDVSVGVEPAGIVVRVQDSGPGIDPALMDEIVRFTRPFSRKLLRALNKNVTRDPVRVLDVLFDLQQLLLPRLLVA